MAVTWVVLIDDRSNVSMATNCFVLKAVTCAVVRLLTCSDVRAATCAVVSDEILLVVIAMRSAVSIAAICAVVNATN